MQPTKEQLQVVKSDEHLLVTGGPGTGKTTVAILKAAHFAKHYLGPGQKVLFLSFARATVSRLIEALEHEQKVPASIRRRIDVQTYHSFFWRLLQSHGYLIGLPRRLRILSPPDEAVALSEIRASFPKRNLSEKQIADKKAAEERERIRLAFDDGRICFELFAPLVGDIIHGSQRIRKLIATMFPVIILDEFQDTNGPQWRVVNGLGEYCQLMALADPEQRIYDWIGADPERLDQYREAFQPMEIDLSGVNHRSGTTDILLFGNDVLKKRFRQPAYKGVYIDLFPPVQRRALTKLVSTVHAARRRLTNRGDPGWSLGILVPTKKLTREVSDALYHPPAGMPRVPHIAVVDMEAAILAAEVLALLLQPAIDDNHFGEFINVVCNYFQGKGGDKPTRAALREAEKVRRAYNQLLERQAEGRAPRKTGIIANLLSTYEQTRALILTGNPDKDWLVTRQTLADGKCKRLKAIAAELLNVRLLNRGSQLRHELAQDWRENGSYSNALSIIRQAFLTEHFSAGTQPETGVIVMNMHKAKGKQFDEVIVFEGWPRPREGQEPYNPDRIIRYNLEENINEQTCQNFRVSITRAKYRVTILTPSDDPCVLLKNLLEH